VPNCDKAAATSTIKPLKYQHGWCCIYVHLLIQCLTIYLRFNSHFSRWTWVSRHQKVSILDFIETKGDRGGGDNWSCKTRKAPVKSPTYYVYSVFIGLMPFLSPNQQYKSTEGWIQCTVYSDDLRVCVTQIFTCSADYAQLQCDCAHSLLLRWTKTSWTISTLRPQAKAALCLSVRFKGHFPGEPGLAGVYWS